MILDLFGYLAAKAIITFLDTVFGPGDRFDWTPEDDAAYEGLCGTDA